MKIKWFGHSCFLITADNGVSVLTDPFDGTVGYKVPEVAADIVTTSHDHHDHNYTQAVQGDFLHVNKTGTFSHKGIEMVGVATFHDERNGAQRGKNTIYKFIVDGIHICHCGDLGHMLTPEQMKEIGHVDTLLLPVGGFATIGPEQAVEVTKLLNPSLIIPMHFQTEVLNFPLAGVEDFLEKMGGGQHVGKQEVEFDKESLGSVSSVMVFEYE
ncbi:MBL fold metallo-hydrolase [Sporomusa sp. KB1]|jgi:L-ascorbate metabolism protein UlaG (beta-lactamase superfamily)|uniref:MBL fold metallo-hydrolase n=1 Tax=Sporomusa sp. KB1 TaxID=943346 RepID=UPI0011A73C89|nr:MBL fold metallo-hydrolase [Sporomusa sp. KB1]TWH52005.1 L-ascorbate metabolism protein UlaG (beta-lactamase superfamily) [Sporomusa sp. KB1]